MRGLLRELGLEGFDSVTIRMDNQGAIALAKNPEFPARTKHINIRHHFIREVESTGLIRLDYVPTNDIAADGLTICDSNGVLLFLTLLLLGFGRVR